MQLNRNSIALYVHPQTGYYTRGRKYCPIILLVTTHSTRFKTGDVGSSVTKSGCQLEWYSLSPRE
jgi:hypothetical protein